LAQLGPGEGLGRAQRSRWELWSGGSSPTRGTVVRDIFGVHPSETELSWDTD